MPPRGHSSHDKGKGKIHSDEKDESGSSRIDQSIAGKQESFGSGVTPDRSWDGVGRASSLNLAYPTEDNERARSSSNEINWGSSQSSQDSDHDARNVAIFGSQVGTTASQWVTGFAASCSSCGLDVAQKCAKELERIAMEMDAVAPAAENAEGRLKAIVSESLSRIAARQPPDCPGVDISACLVTEEGFGLVSSGGGQAVLGRLFHKDAAGKDVLFAQPLLANEESQGRADKCPLHGQHHDTLLAQTKSDFVSCAVSRSGDEQMLIIVPGEVSKCMHPQEAVDIAQRHWQTRGSQRAAATGVVKASLSRHKKHLPRHELASVVVRF